ncbi:MAG: RHS repeat-associated core domain-containing protein [Undibacterium sp.]|nr:RHS repeat-associated core domain-containing protein [Undibacterium sp.]
MTFKRHLTFMIRLLGIILLTSMAPLQAQTSNPIAPTVAPIPAIVTSPPVLNVSPPPATMIAGQSYTVTWSSSNADWVEFNCSASGTGYVDGGEVALAGNKSITADPLWVNYQSTCTWKAVNAYGETPKTYTMTTTAASTPAALTLACSGGATTTSPTAATMSCTVANTGQTAVSSITYSSIPGVALSGQPTSCGANATCGTVTLTTATAPATYSGTLTATPNAGTAASKAVSMIVNSIASTPAVLSLACSGGATTTSPTAATMSCTVANTGQTAVSSITYSSIPGVALSGQPTSCAASATCGTVTLTTATAPATYSGTLTATPNAGTAASKAVSMIVNPVVTGSAVLTLTACANINLTTSPTPASTRCTVTNTSTTAATSISYALNFSGASAAGPTGSCAGNTVCGNVTVTTVTGAGHYVGTLTATPTPGGASAPQAIDLTVNPAAGTETVTYIHTDGLGSPVAKSNAGGVRITQTKYEAYGMTVAGSDVPTIGFTGHVNDADTGLTYMQQRYYDPVAARFLSEDPVLTDANTGAAFNRYAYAQNNPYKYIDPDGRAAEMKDFCSGRVNCSTLIDNRNNESKSVMDSVVAYQNLSPKEQQAARAQADAIEPFYGVEKLAFSGWGVAVGARIFSGVVAAEGVGEAYNVANATKLADQLTLESARSPFTAAGTLTQDAINSAKAVKNLGPGQLSNPAIPSGFGKYTTGTFQSPAGDFQMHFYKNSTGQVFYGLDYKAIFNSMSGVPK